MTPCIAFPSEPLCSDTVWDYMNYFFDQLWQFFCYLLWPNAAQCHWDGTLLISLSSLARLHFPRGIGVLFWPEIRNLAPLQVKRTMLNSFPELMRYWLKLVGLKFTAGSSGMKSHRSGKIVSILIFLTSRSHQSWAYSTPLSLMLTTWRKLCKWQHENRENGLQGDLCTMYHTPQV